MKFVADVTRMSQSKFTSHCFLDLSTRSCRSAAVLCCTLGMPAAACLDFRRAYTQVFFSEFLEQGTDDLCFLLLPLSDSSACLIRLQNLILYCLLHALSILPLLNAET